MFQNGAIMRNSSVNPYLIIDWGPDESQEWGLSGRVQYVGLMSWVNTRPLICLASPARSADAREARFYGEYVLTKYLVLRFG